MVEARPETLLSVNLAENPRLTTLDYQWGGEPMWLNPNLTYEVGDGLKVTHVGSADAAFDLLPGVPMGVMAGKTYTFGIDVIRQEPGGFVQTVLGFQRGEWSWTDVAANRSAAVPIGAGTYRSVVSGTVPADADALMVGVIMGASSAPVWLDRVSIEEGATSGEYFDGDTPDGATDDDPHYRWAGASRASASERYLPAVEAVDEPVVPVVPPQMTMFSALKPLGNGEFALNGFRFGCGHSNIGVSTLNATSIRWRVQDQSNPVGDNILTGRDYGDPQPIKLGVFFSGNTAEEVAQAAAEFANAWATAQARKPGEDSVLEIGVHGRTLRAYGRPRDLDIDDTDIFSQRHAEGTAIFDRSDMFFYGDPDNGGGGQVTLSITPPQAQGLVFPVVFPWGTFKGGERQGVVVNAGLRPTQDVTITINGTVSNPVVSGDGWEIQLNTSLAYDRSVTINARNRTVTRDDGVSLAGTLTRKSRLDQIVVPPGSSEFFFRGTSVDGSATATIRWGSAHTSLGA